MLKTCHKCHVEQPLDGFSRRSDKPDGHSNVCRACDTARCRLRYQRDGATMRAQASARYHASPETVKGRNRRWIQANPDKVQGQRQRADARRRGTRGDYKRDYDARRAALLPAQADPLFRAAEPGQEEAGQEEAGFSLVRFRSGRYAALPFGRPLPAGAVLVSRWRWLINQWFERRADQ